MCYSGICYWEDYEGNCRFPLDNQIIAKKYPHRLCGIGITSKEEEEHYNQELNKVKIILKEFEHERILRHILS